MSKLTRDYRAFARRVQMGRGRLWLLVEGRTHDRPFYDRVLASHPVSAAGGYTVRLAEQIEVDGVAAGGKDHLIKLFQVLKSDDLLEVENSRGVNRIAIAMDRDYDHMSDQIIDSPHIIYTLTMDVEADILLHGDLTRAISSGFSIANADARLVGEDGRALAQQLSELWRDWIALGACAACCSVDLGVRHSRQSRIHVGGFGELDASARDRLFESLDAQVATEAAGGVVAATLLRVGAEIEAGMGWNLIKGRWLAGYVWQLVRTVLSEVPREVNVGAEVVVKTCVETINFEGEWADEYRARLDRLLAS